MVQKQTSKQTKTKRMRNLKVHLGFFSVFIIKSWRSVPVESVYSNEPSTKIIIIIMNQRQRNNLITATVSAEKQIKTDYGGRMAGWLGGWISIQ